TFTIVLQKGETYSAKATSHLAADHPTGSHIVSNKPIAVTVKDDSVLEPSSYDLAGDQLIPVNYIGVEYIAIKTSTTTTSDRLYILAINDNTSIFIDGNPEAIINTGETHEFIITAPS